MTTNLELAHFVEDADAHTTEMSAAVQFAARLVAAHLQNDTPADKAMAVKGLANGHSPEYHNAINTYLAALNTRYIDGEYSEQDARMMNVSVAEIVKELLLHQQNNGISQAPER